jgi:hypothetical protein
MGRTITNRQRVIDHGEVFTPAELVSSMLDLVAQECERIDSRFLEPACGNGNFLAEVLRRKLATADKHNGKFRQRWERDAVLAVCSLYGVDLLADNVAECRERLLQIVLAAHDERFREALPEEAARAIEFVLSRNILQGDALSLQAGDGKPITFSEWSPLNGSLIKRRDFVYKHLLEHAHIANTPLFSDLGKDVFVPKPVREFPPMHYLKVPDAEVPVPSMT